AALMPEEKQEMAQEVDLLTYNPLDRKAQQDPFPYYAALRKEAPVYHHKASGLYFISSMDAVLEVLTAPSLFSSKASKPDTAPEGAIGDELREIARSGFPNVSTMLTADPPAQTRYRKSIGKPFGPRRIKEFEPLLREVCADLIEAWPDQGEVAFLESFAMPFPIGAISHALGMAPSLAADIKRWSDDSVAALGARISDSRRLEAAQGVVESQKYWASRYEQAQADPVGDIVSNLVNADFEDHMGVVRKLDVNEFISMMRQFMVAGNETTTKLLTSGIRLLIENPEEWKKIQQDPSLIPPMVEEVLRIASPNQGLFRTVTEDTELQGIPLRAGDRLWVIFGSANRDEKYFPDPDRFNPARENLRSHLAFGKGTHVCPGAPLARLEARVAFEELVSSVESFAFAPGYKAEYEPSYVLRGLTRLDVVLKKHA
ncbi:MAG: cytochrome P450, partial [Myxococcota bacterium]|nr:cytochrome P450 [Myxococcota bacterium]